MNTKVAVRKCKEYNLEEVYNNISDIYRACDGPVVTNKRVLLKPNILIECDPSRCVSTHPVVVEAAIRRLSWRNGHVSQ